MLPALIILACFMVMTMPSPPDNYDSPIAQYSSMYLKKDIGLPSNHVIYS